MREQTRDRDMLVNDLTGQILASLKLTESAGFAPLTSEGKAAQETIRKVLSSWFEPQARAGRAYEARKDAATKEFERANRYREQCEASVYRSSGELGVARARLAHQEREHERRTSGMQRKLLAQAREIKRLTALLDAAASGASEGTVNESVTVRDDRPQRHIQNTEEGPDVA